MPSAEADEAEERAEQEHAEAERARAEAAAEVEAIKAINEALGDSQYQMQLIEKQLERSRGRVERLKGEAGIFYLPKARSEEEWKGLKKTTFHVAKHREQVYLKRILKMREWNVEALAGALQDLNLVVKLFKTQPFFMVYYDKVKDLIKGLENDDFSVVFGLYLHYKMAVVTVRGGKHGCILRIGGVRARARRKFYT